MPGSTKEQRKKLAMTNKKSSPMYTVAITGMTSREPLSS